MTITPEMQEALLVVRMEDAYFSAVCWSCKQLVGVHRRDELEACVQVRPEGDYRDIVDARGAPKANVFLLNAHWMQNGQLPTSRCQANNTVVADTELRLSAPPAALEVP